VGETGAEELLSTATRPNLKANQRKFNLATYKTHLLGDYIKSIHMYGTTDSYSTQLVSTMQKFMVITHNNLGQARAPSSKEVLSMCAQRPVYPRYHQATAP
jgi:hypothetical protein